VVFLSGRGSLPGRCKRTLRIAPRLSSRIVTAHEGLRLDYGRSWGHGRRQHNRLEAKHHLAAKKPGRFAAANGSVLQAILQL